MVEPEGPDEAGGVDVGGAVPERLLEGRLGLTRPGVPAVVHDVDLGRRRAPCHVRLRTSGETRVSTGSWRQPLWAAQACIDASTPVGSAVPAGTDPLKKFWSAIRTELNPPPA